MSDSESSRLSTPPATDDEMPPPPEVVVPVKVKAKGKKRKQNGTILSFFEAPSPARKKRPASPPHEMVPEDNADIAFIVMFRSRFTEVFPAKCPHLGPQDVERGVADTLPSPLVESLLCALLGLVLNRKKPVEKGHYGRALEEAVQTQKTQWPREWHGANPLSGGRTFNTMSPTERLTLLKTLILWGLSTSESVSNAIKESYKARTSKILGDANIPLSVQPWGRDGDKRRYWLVEGQDDTAFRVYRESNPALKTVSWWSVAGSIDEIRILAQKLETDDGTKEARILSEKMLSAIPRFEATEEKRKRREYRMIRKAAFTRPEPGFSMYEGRTRGKRMKYTFSDEEEDYGSDALSVRRSTRHSGRDTPTAHSGPTVTASGRQVRSRATGLYGESLLSGQTTEGASPAGDYLRSDGSEEPAHGRPTRAAAQGASHGWSKTRSRFDANGDMEDDAETSSGGEWDGGDEDDDADRMDADDNDDLDEESEDDVPKSLVVRLKISKGTTPSTSFIAAPLPTLQTQEPVVAAIPASMTPVPNGIQEQQKTAPAAPIAQTTPSPADTYPVSKVDPLGFSAPTPPYVAPEEAEKMQYDVSTTTLPLPPVTLPATS
ncbi:hypothetical protein P154DRAFT_518610 [Amniculicola lignicola CBS 123094]|uniref:WHIM1 domain-containing protein n=1 Tax=Amniculicola lignicola CBS 123094 TaxID=1392246 RepID=A0A6A5WVA5_9PLEO|nr:hypothetical protein P154DRAFT_518610 [Amniculicola lignicola CBS 123094]